MKIFSLNTKFKKRSLSLIVLGALLIVGFLGIRALVQSSDNSSKEVVLRDAISKKDINKDFSFAIKDDAGKEVTKLGYKIENAELRDQILIKGKSASAVTGKKFLILNVKLNNTFNRSIELTAKDYVRLTVNNNPELIAPDIHNDPVIIQPISTQVTRIGFAIKDDDKDLVIKAGEINGPKTDIEIKF